MSSEVFEPGDAIDDRYRVVRLLGAGAMGQVYEGVHTRIERRVAIKVLKAAVAERQSVVRRFEREARAAARIGSPHIVDVLDFGELPGGQSYLVMEYLDGESLRARLDRDGVMAPRELLGAVRQILEGLDAAHEADIVHRDIKPANVLLCRGDRKHPEGVVKIVDFGVAKFRSADSSLLTESGIVMGTPRYMAPEQVLGQPDVDGRADIFSVGVMMFRALCGRPPFSDATANALMFRVVGQDVPPLDRFVKAPDPRLAAIVAKATARDLGQRYQTARAMADDVDALLADGDALTGRYEVLPGAAGDDATIDSPLTHLGSSASASASAQIGSATGIEVGHATLDGQTSHEPTRPDVAQPIASPKSPSRTLLLGAALALGAAAAVGMSLRASSGASPSPAASSAATAAEPRPSVATAEPSGAPRPSIATHSTSSALASSAAAPSSRATTSPEASSPPASRTATPTTRHPSATKQPPPATPTVTRPGLILRTEP